MKWTIVAGLSLLISLFLANTGAHPYTRTRRDAADNPTGKPCAVDRYQCDGGSKCIPLKWICDEVNDCKDTRDERNCVFPNKNTTVNNLNRKDIQEAQHALDETTTKSTNDCPRGKFSCDSGKKCLVMSSLCDTVHDCYDGSDENNCEVTQSSACESSKFSCDGGVKCLPLTWLCDSIDDCTDQKDEYNCPARMPGSSLARAAQEAAITAAQEAKRAALAAQDMMKSAKEAADKAKRAMEIAEASKE